MEQKKCVEKYKELEQLLQIQPDSIATDILELPIQPNIVVDDNTQRIRKLRSELKNCDSSFFTDEQWAVINEN